MAMNVRCELTLDDRVAGPARLREVCVAHIEPKSVACYRMFEVLRVQVDGVSLKFNRHKAHHADPSVLNAFRTRLTCACRRFQVKASSEPESNALVPRFSRLPNILHIFAAQAERR